MNVSLRDFRSLASSTSWMTREAVDSPNSLVTRTRSTPDTLTQPESTSSSTATARGTLSPVRATVLRLLLPAITTPSSGTRSPGAMTMMSPTATSSDFTSTVSPPRSTRALSGRISIRWEIESRLRCSA